MATPKKKNKIRDYDRTRKRLLEIVGEILKEAGFQGLKTNNIAKRLGKDKNLIRYYFHSLYNLEKTYILENDHWFSFFERLEMPRGQDHAQLKQLFIDLMLENFIFFGKNIEMQKVMLWQISEKNPLMRSISDYREQEAEKMFKAIEPCFSGSDVNFRAIASLILGGVYFLSLQAETNKGTVCGIDINLEKDNRAVSEAIKQIIGWAWEKGAEKDGKRRLSGR